MDVRYGRGSDAPALRLLFGRKETARFWESGLSLRLSPLSRLSTFDPLRTLNSKDGPSPALSLI